MIINLPVEIVSKLVILHTKKGHLIGVLFSCVEDRLAKLHHSCRFTRVSENKNIPFFRKAPSQTPPYPKGNFLLSVLPMINRTYQKKGKKSQI